MKFILFVTLLLFTLISFANVKVTNPLPIPIEGKADITDGTSLSVSLNAFKDYKNIYFDVTCIITASENESYISLKILPDPIFARFFIDGKELIDDIGNINKGNHTVIAKLIRYSDDSEETEKFMKFTNVHSAVMTLKSCIAKAH